jgi:UDP-galactopyranose mutase
VISKEYPMEHNDSNTPFYPKPFGDNPLKYKKYKGLAMREKKTIFVGRLATYKYLDMDDAIAQTLTKLKKV